VPPDGRAINEGPSKKAPSVVPLYAPLRDLTWHTVPTLAFRGRPRWVLQSVKALINALCQFGNRHLQPASQPPKHAHDRLLLATLHQGDERPVKVWAPKEERANLTRPFFFSSSCAVSERQPCRASSAFDGAAAHQAHQAERCTNERQ